GEGETDRPPSPLPQFLGEGLGVGAGRRAWRRRALTAFAEVVALEYASPTWSAAARRAVRRGGHEPAGGRRVPGAPVPGRSGLAAANPWRSQARCPQSAARFAAALHRRPHRGPPRTPS